MNRFKLAATLALAALAITSTASAVIPDAAGTLPVLGAETRVGSIVRSPVAPVAPSVKTVDGDPSDWIGAPTRLGGTSVYSAGELVYQDYLNDAWGADDGYDAERLATLDDANQTEPRTYRIDALQQAAGEQFGADRPAGADISYGDTAADTVKRTSADLLEARAASDGTALQVMIRTARMDDPVVTAALLLLDTADGGSYAAPGGVVSGAEYAFVVHDSSVLSASYAGTAISPAGIVVASDPGATTGPLHAIERFVNTIEVSIPLSLIGSPASFSIAIGTGIAGESGFAALRTGDAASDLIDLAFNGKEPARIWMDKRQALALRAGEIDGFFEQVDVAALTGGRTETFQQRPGYYERIYVDPDTPVNREYYDNGSAQGPFHHYGVYLPQSYRPGLVLPATFWMHYRGGHAHDAAAWLPGVMRNFGEDIGAIVFTPSARGTSSWYTGRGMADFLAAWDDAMANYPVDQGRVYIGGHSMGGWASNLLPILMPDRFAAANPEDGLLVPGLWAGAGPPTGPQQGADINAEFLYPLLENTYNVPYAILHGTADELVPVTGAIAQGARLHELGHQYRTYLFHAYEHYSAPIWDDWRDVVAYMAQFRRDPNPPRVVFKISPALDNAVSRIGSPAGVDLGLRFNKAYWVSDLETRTAGIAPSNIGHFDGYTFGRGTPKRVLVPEAGTAQQTGPYTMHGQRWVGNGVESPWNGFALTATNLATATLDLPRMAIGTSWMVFGDITTDGPMDLRLSGTWTSAPTVAGATATWDASGLTLHLTTAGYHEITIAP